MVISGGATWDTLDKNWMVIDGFKTSGGACLGGGTYDPNLNSTFHNNAFRHIDSPGTGCNYGISAFNGLQDVVIEESVFRENPNSHGIYLGSRGMASSNVWVRRNILYDNYNSGIQFNGRVTGLIIEANLIYHNKNSRISLRKESKTPLSGTTSFWTTETAHPAAGSNSI